MSNSSVGSYKSTSFYIVLPSNTCVEGNRNNSFRVRLPRKLQFNAQWSVGLAVLVYPHSWPSLGTTEPQYVRIEWEMPALEQPDHRDDFGHHQQMEIAVPAAHLKSPGELLTRLRTALEASSDTLAKHLAALQKAYTQAESAASAYAKKTVREGWAKSVVQPDADDDDEEEQGGNVSNSTEQQRQHGGDVVEMDERLWQSAAIQRWYWDVRSVQLDQELATRMSQRERQWLEATRSIGTEAWVHAFANPEECCRFGFDVDTQRFRLKLDRRYVRCVHLSAQLAYILGFEQQTMLAASSQQARYVPDMRGGVSSFFVYAPQLIEPVFIGDVAAPVLRVVNIRGQPDEVIEECYTAIQYHRLIMKEFSEVQIEIRTANGALMPFQYGTCTLTLHFKKIPYF